MDPEQKKKRIVEWAKKTGFDLIRVSPALIDQKYPETFHRWISSGQHGEMDYLAKRIRNGITLESLCPDVKSVLSLAVNYYYQDRRARKATEGVISRYALTRDYHKVLKKKLKLVCRFIEENFLAKTIPYVDTGPILEKAHAETGGLGYIGKNSCLITEKYGSWVFLAEILTSLELPYDKKSLKLRCGACKRCRVECPTNAINSDYTIDSRKCISYLTIENKGPIPVELRESIGPWLFGCDICQEVCPHNSRQIPARLEKYTEIRIKDRLIPLQTILDLDSEEKFLDLFAGTPLMRAKRRGLMRNACVVAGNSGELKLISSLQKIASGKDQMLKEHARWAIDKLLN